MTALTNPVEIPFFERIPPRAQPAVARAAERISRGAAFATTAMGYNLLCAELREAAAAAPSYNAFKAWAAGQISIGDENSAPSVGGAQRAYAVIAQAWALHGAKRAAGYSSECCEAEDVIVADAIHDWLTEEADRWSEAMNLDCTPAEVAVLILDLDLEGGDSGGKLLDVLATHMQAELCAAIVHRGQEGGAA